MDGFRLNADDYFFFGFKALGFYALRGDLSFLGIVLVLCSWYEEFKEWIWGLGPGSH